MIDNDEFFVGNAVHDSHAQRAAAALRTGSRRSQGFFSLAARLARDRRV